MSEVNATEEIEINSNKDRLEISSYSDLIIVFIGFGILFLAMLTSVGEVPKEFSIGATMAGVFFALADFALLPFLVFKKTRVIVIFYLTNLFLGVLSFIVLPTIFLMYPVWANSFLEKSDGFTFLALGIVLGILGFKNHFTNNVNRNKLTEKQTALEIRAKELDKRVSEYEQEQREVTKKAIELLTDLIEKKHS